MADQRDLIAAIKCGDTDTFARILRNGVNVNAVNDIGWTPLFYAVAVGDIRMTYELLKKGARIDQRDYSGWTPLEHASLDGNSEIQSVLLSYEDMSSEAVEPRVQTLVM